MELNMTIEVVGDSPEDFRFKITKVNGAVIKIPAHVKLSAAEAVAAAYTLLPGEDVESQRN